MQEANRYKRVSLAERRRAESRRLKVAAASFALVGVLAVGGTMAWLSDESEEVTNTFQPVEVTCEVHETFEHDIKSDVYVENTGDVDAYIRAEVIVSWMKVETVDGAEKVTVLSDNPVEDTHYTVEYNMEDWVEGADGYWYCKKGVPAGANTENLIESISLKEGVEAPEADYYLSVEIIASAIQADGVNGSETPAVVDAWYTDVNNLSVDSGTLSVSSKA